MKWQCGVGGQGARRAVCALGLGAWVACLVSAGAMLPGMAAAQGGARAAVQVEVRGAGATFPALVYARWAQKFAQANPGVKVTYAPTGSGDGVKQVTARSVQFGGTDVPLSAQKLQDAKLVQIPMLVGGLVPVLNLPGVEGNQLAMDGPLLADIFQGQVTRWDDARIAALNPGVRLPALPIVRLVRQEASGSTETLLRYLGEASARFKAAVPVSGLPAWPAGGPGAQAPRAAKGNDGLVTLLRATPGGIAVVSFDRVLRDHLAAVRLKNAAGKAVVASEAAFRAAILASELHQKGDDTASLLNRPRPDAWPLTATSFVLLDATPKDMVAAEWTARFVHWCFVHGDELTRDTGFAPLPDRVQARLAGRLLQVHGPQGETPNFMAP